MDKDLIFRFSSSDDETINSPTQPPPSYDNFIKLSEIFPQSDKKTDKR